MSRYFDLINHFTDCNIEFPSTVVCAPILNDLFKKGLSLNQFEAKYQRLAKSKFIIPTSCQSSIQYNLQIDQWGAKEMVAIHKTSEDYNLSIVCGMRNSDEYNAVITFLNKQSNVELVQNKPGDVIFSVMVPYTTWERTREIAIGVQRQTGNTALVTILLNF